jgi:type VI secretion system protein ImpG
VFLTLVDRRFQPAQAAEDVLSVKTLCTNRDLPSRLPLGDARGDFQCEGLPSVSRIRCLRKPTVPGRRHLQGDTRWRLISHLSLNYLSISEVGSSDAASEGTKERQGALDALKELLRLYDFSDSAVTRQRIDGLVGLSSRRVTRRVHHADGGFARGIEIELLFDEEKYAGGSVFLFASVLERFLGQYASINSFTQTVARLRQREGALKRWPPRAGMVQLL